MQVELGPLGRHVKSRQIHESIDVWRQSYDFFIQISWYNLQETTSITILDNDLFFLLPFKRN